MKPKKFTITQTKLTPTCQTIFDGWIKPDFSGKHGIVIENAQEYIMIYSKKVIILLIYCKDRYADAF